MSYFYPEVAARKIAQARVRKAARFISAFDDVIAETAGVQSGDLKGYAAAISDPANIEKAIAQIEGASSQQWKQLAASMGEHDAPSAETRELMVQALRARLPKVCRTTGCGKPASGGDHLCLQCQVDELQDASGALRGLVKEGAL